MCGLDHVEPGNYGKGFNSVKGLKGEGGCND